MERFRPGADAAVTIGFVGAVGAALTGMADWIGVTRKDVRLA